MVDDRVPPPTTRPEEECCWKTDYFNGKITCIMGSLTYDCEGNMSEADPGGGEEGLLIEVHYSGTFKCECVTEPCEKGEEEENLIITDCEETEMPLIGSNKPVKVRARTFDYYHKYADGDCKDERTGNYPFLAGRGSTGDDEKCEYDDAFECKFRENPANLIFLAVAADGDSNNWNFGQPGNEEIDAIIEKCANEIEQLIMTEVDLTTGEPLTNARTAWTVELELCLLQNLCCTDENEEDDTSMSAGVMLLLLQGLTTGGEDKWGMENNCGEKE